MNSLENKNPYWAEPSQDLNKISFPIYFNGGAFLAKHKGTEENPLNNLIFISVSYSEDEKGNRDLFIDETFFSVEGEDMEGLKVYDFEGTRVNQRELLIVDWKEKTGKTMDASLTFILGAYNSGIKKIGESRYGNLKNGNYRFLADYILNYILEDWRL